MLQTEKLQQKEEYQEEIMPDTLKFQDPVSIEEEESLTPYLDKYTENVTEKIRCVFIQVRCQALLFLN